MSGFLGNLFGNLTHFQALLFFAFIVSATFAFLSKRTTSERVQYAAWAFIAFALVAVGIGWLMFPFSC